MSSLSCSFCNRQAYADAVLPKLGSIQVYVCKSHFIREECSFREGGAELIMAEPPTFNTEADELLQDFESFLREDGADGSNANV